MRSSALLLVLLISGSVAAVPSPLRFQKTSSWVGQTVILKKSSITIHRTSDDQPLGTLNRTDYVVIREKDDRIWVRDLSREGWIYKNDVVRISDALQYLTEEINKTPNDSYLFAKRSKVHEFKGDLNAALKDYDEANRLLPNSSGWINNRGNLHQKMRNFDKALEDYNRSVELNANSAIVFNNRGNSYNHLRQYERALEDYNRAIQLDPTYNLAYVNRANCYREQKMYDKALKDADEAIKRESFNATAYSMKASILAAQKKFDEAFACIDTALTKDLRSSSAFFNRGVIYQELKKIDHAIWDYDHAIWLDPRLIGGFTQRGLCYLTKKKYDLAKKDFEAAMKLDTKYPPTLNAYAWFLACCPEDQYRDGKKALELAKQANELTSFKKPEYLSTLAAAQAEASEFDQAIQTQEKAMSDPEFAKERGEKIKKRLQLYREKKPYRLEFED